MEKTKFSIFKSKITDIVQLTENVKHFRISVQNDFSFIPGQYISIIMDNPDRKIKLRKNLDFIKY